MDAQKPFILRGGKSSDASTFNRINIIERLKYLTGVDLRTKSVSYLKALDLELWYRWYRNEEVKPVDETFCQRSAEVIRAMEDLPAIELDNVKHLDAYQTFQNRVKEGEAHDHQHAESRGEDAGGRNGQKGDSGGSDKPGES